MSRPHKIGLDYFPHDTDACADEKIQSLMALYGAAGYAFYFIILEKVFRSENGRINCGKPAEKAGLARTICISIKEFDEILNTALEIGCFDEKEFFELKEITSVGIKKRLEKVNILREKDKSRKEKEKEKVIQKEKEDKDKEKEKAKNGKPLENSRKTLGKLKTAPQPPKGDFVCEEVLNDLNHQSGKHFRLTPDTKSKIQSRINEGFTLEDFKKVHTNMAAKWKGDEKWDQYLRPLTLYCASKFQGYLNQKGEENADRTGIFDRIKKAGSSVSVEITSENDRGLC